MVNWQEPFSCGRAHRPDRAAQLGPPLLLTCLLATACGRAAGPAAPAETPVPPPATEALCVAADSGALRARLSGAIEAEIDWSASGEPQCRGSVRPSGDGLRLVYRGNVPETGPLLIVLGAGPLRPGESARNVPVNITLVREGSGEFFATQGDDKCAFDVLHQTPIEGAAKSFRVEGRGFCMQPARAVGGGPAVLISRFDVTAVVDEFDDADDTAPAGDP